jgi:hypothetical protein
VLFTAQIVTYVSKHRYYVITLPGNVRSFTHAYGRIHRIVSALITREYGSPWRAGEPQGTSDQLDHGMETRMLLRGHLFGALTLAFISIARASVISAAAIFPALHELSRISNPHIAQ